MPIGIDLHGRWVFLYLATDNELDRFRCFLQRHFDLFSQLPAWTLRIVVPPHVKTLADICQEVARSEFARPIDERLVKMLGSYFKQRQAHEQGAAVENEEEYDQAHFAFRAAGYQVLYRRWLRLGEAALDGRSSSAIADASARDAGAVESVVLPHQYGHLMARRRTNLWAFRPYLRAERLAEGPAVRNPRVDFRSVVEVVRERGVHIAERQVVF